MIMANVHQIKVHFSEYLSKLERGETIIICKRNVPIAEIHAIHQPIKKARAIGLAKGTFEIPESFFETLPEDIIKFFHSE